MEYLQYEEFGGYRRNCTRVLNLVISGIPSIPKEGSILSLQDLVLNLVISGIPSIRKNEIICNEHNYYVLNLVISGIPSIRGEKMENKKINWVLNLVISGIPSIL